MAHAFSAQRVEFLRALARAVKIDPGAQPIVSMTLDAQLHSVPTVTIKMLLDQEADVAIAEVIKTYEFDEKPVATTTTWRDDKPLP